MKKILLILLFPFLGKSQNDTIFKVDGKVIPCTVTLANEGAVFFKDKKGNGDELINSKIKYYSVAGKRIVPPNPTVIDYKLFQIDTTRNELGQIKLSKVFEYKDTSLTKNKLYERAKEFIFKTYVSGNNVTLYEDKEIGKFFCRAITKKVDYMQKLDAWHWAEPCNGGYFMYNMTIYTKNQKVKIVFDQITHYKGDCPYESNTGSDFGDSFPKSWQPLEINYNTEQYKTMKATAFKDFILILNYLDKISSSKKDDGDF
jgi:hypothetical protein